jgi:cytochrome oxidase Cu insertion factor (SCO1/SenC/PrrC family)
MMSRKSFLLSTVLLFGSLFLRLQTISAQSTGDIPPFSMILSNGQYFKAADLPKGKPVLLIYFSPDCDHCHTLMNEFFKRTADFRDAEVVMVTFKPVSEVAAFVQTYETFRYPNIKVGTEGTTYYLRYFYKLQNTPFTALYNKQGKLIGSYRKTTPLNEIAKLVKNS